MRRLESLTEMPVRHQRNRIQLNVLHCLISTLKDLDSPSYPEAARLQMMIPEVW